MELWTGEMDKTHGLYAVCLLSFAPYEMFQGAVCFLEGARATGNERGETWFHLLTCTRKIILR